MNLWRRNMEHCCCCLAFGTCVPKFPAPQCTFPQKWIRFAVQWILLLPLPLSLHIYNYICSQLCCLLVNTRTAASIPQSMERISLVVALRRFCWALSHHRNLWWNVKVPVTWVRGYRAFPWTECLGMKWNVVGAASQSHSLRLSDCSCNCNISGHRSQLMCHIFI